MSILFIKVPPLSWKHFLLKTLICFKWHIQSRWKPQRCSGTHTLGLSLLCLSVSDITRHQVCTGGLWEAVQTNHRPGFLSKENKPSRWDTFIIFWEGSLIQGLGTDMRVAQARSCRLVNSIKCRGYVFGRIVLRQTGLNVCNSEIVSLRFKMSVCTNDPQCFIEYNIESLTKSLIVPLTFFHIFVSHLFQAGFVLQVNSATECVFSGSSSLWSVCHFSALFTLKALLSGASSLFFFGLHKANG